MMTGTNRTNRWWSTVAISAALAGTLALACPWAADAKPPRLQPTRIHSIGDSITTAFDSYFILNNPSESWVNGYYGFFQQLFGWTNVNSHMSVIREALSQK